MSRNLQQEARTNHRYDVGSVLTQKGLEGKLPGFVQGVQTNLDYVLLNVLQHFTIELNVVQFSMCNLLQCQCRFRTFHRLPVGPEEVEDAVLVHLQ